MTAGDGPAMTAGVIGVILAGGDNRRYGDHKALAEVGGARIVDRVIRKLSNAVDTVLIVANDLERYGALGLPVRADRRPGEGALGGIYTAVWWAREAGGTAALVAACDMPFLSSGLLRELARQAAPDAVCFPASRGPRGIEPLCAAYGVECVGAIELALDRGDRTIVSALSEVRQVIIPLETVESYGDPELLFLNVNRPSDRERAESLLGELDRHGPAP